MKNSSRFSRWVSLVAVCAVSGLAAAAARADTSSSTHDFPNPNGCHAYDGSVVDLSCDWAPSKGACHGARDTINKIAQSLNEFHLNADCTRYHTDSDWAHFWDEQIMESDAFDGYRVELTLDRVDESHDVAQSAVITASDAATCGNAAEALRSLNGHGASIDATCTGASLEVRISQ